MNSLSDLGETLFLYKILASVVVLMALSGLLLELRLFKRRIGRGFWALVLVGAAVAAWTWTLPASREYLPHAFFVLFVFLIMLWLAVAALVRREREAWVIGAGILRGTRSATSRPDTCLPRRPSSSPRRSSTTW